MCWSPIVTTPPAASTASISAAQGVAAHCHAARGRSVRRRQNIAVFKCHFLPLQIEHITACNLTVTSSKNSFDATDEFIGWTNCRYFHFKGVFVAVFIADSNFLAHS